MKASFNPAKIKFADVKLETGVRLRYAEQGEAGGRVVILLHGYADSWFSYSRVLPLFEAKYHVFVLDQRGHGESDRPETGYKFDDFARDVVAFMDAKKIKSAVVVGHSMGSFVAQGVAVNAPERVEKLVLIGTAATVKSSAVIELEKAVKELKDPVPVDFIREFQISASSPDLPGEFFGRILAESRKLPARVWRETMRGMLAADYRDQLERIKAPTMIVWGDKEPIFLRPEQDELLAKITSGENQRLGSENLRGRRALSAVGTAGKIRSRSAGFY
jgi:pimeloyl-ACP methyl ester carboxylesterase